MSETAERNFIVGIFGENLQRNMLIGQALGAPGTKSDIQFYNRLDLELKHIFCGITPLDYPDKIKPFLQSLALTNIHILVIDINANLNALIGEIIVALDLYHQFYNTRVIVVFDGIDSKSEWKLSSVKERLNKILDTTSLKACEIMEIKSKEDYLYLKKKIIDIGEKILESEKKIRDKTKILIDHAFPVKGIGTVILGVVKEGEIQAGQMLELTGYNGPGKKVIIRSIQKHDRKFKKASQGERIGLALKGNISSKEISRDNILVNQGNYKPEEKITAKVHINEYYKPKGGCLKPGDSIQYNAIVDIKSSPIKFTEGDQIYPGENGKCIIQFEKTFYHDGSGIKGIITNLNKFENKLRIVGYFSQILS